MNKQLTEYKVPADLLQAVINVLNTQPAGNTRMLLNAIEHITVQQDEEEVAVQRAALRAEIAAGIA